MDGGAERQVERSGKRGRGTFKKKEGRRKQGQRKVQCGGNVDAWVRSRLLMEEQMTRRGMALARSCSGGWLDRDMDRDSLWFVMV